MKVEHLAYLGIGLTCLFFLATCDGCDNSENQSYEYSSQDSEDYSWLPR